MSGNVKKWCRHIHWHPIVAPKYRWIVRMDTSLQKGWYEVPRYWKVCPICLVERPTKKNIEAAEMRSLMDGDQ